MAEETVQKNNKKINKLTLAEIETKLKDLKEKTGNLQSRYAQQLLSRKDELAKS